MSAVLIELLRGTIAALGGAVFGLALLQAHLYWKRNMAGEPNDRLLPLVLVRVGTASLVGFAVAELATRYDLEYITWRVPVALLGFLVLGIGLVMLLILDEREQDR